MHTQQDSDAALQNNLTISEKWFPIRIAADTPLHL